MSGRIKGVAVGEFLRWLKLELGDAPLAALLSRMPANHRAAFDPSHPTVGVLAASWYPAEPIHALLDEVARHRSEREVERLVTEGVAAALRQTLGTVHRALLRVVGSPELHARFSQRLWRTYYDHGVCTSVCESPTRQRVEYTGWSAHHPLLCRMTSASEPVIFGSMGLPNVRMRQTECIDDGASACIHLVEWD